MGRGRDTAGPHWMRNGKGHDLGLRSLRDGGVKLSPETHRLRMGKRGEVSLWDGYAVS